jgi:hypothetical protein
MAGRWFGVCLMAAMVLAGCSANPTATGQMHRPTGHRVLEDLAVSGLCSQMATLHLGQRPALGPGLELAASASMVGAELKEPGLTRAAGVLGNRIGTPSRPGTAASIARVLSELRGFCKRNAHKFQLQGSQTQVGGVITGRATSQVRLGGVTPQ